MEMLELDPIGAILMTKLPEHLESSVQALPAGNAGGPLIPKENNGTDSTPVHSLACRTNALCLACHCDRHVPRTGVAGADSLLLLCAS